MASGGVVESPPRVVQVVPHFPTTLVTLHQGPYSPH